jgi:hypothetical protein
MLRHWELRCVPERAIGVCTPGWLCDVGLTAVCASCGQRQRLAFASSWHLRLGECSTVTADLDVVARVCGHVMAQSLATRSDAAKALAAEQRARAQRGASILRGTLV